MNCFPNLQRLVENRPRKARRWIPANYFPNVPRCPQNRPPRLPKLFKEAKLVKSSTSSEDDGSSLAGGSTTTNSRSSKAVETINHIYRPEVPQKPSIHTASPVTTSPNPTPSLTVTVKMSQLGNGSISAITAFPTVHQEDGSLSVTTTLTPTVWIEGANFVTCPPIVQTEATGLITTRSLTVQQADVTNTSAPTPTVQTDDMIATPFPTVQRDGVNVPTCLPTVQAEDTNTTTPIPTVQEGDGTNAATRPSIVRTESMTTTTLSPTVLTFSPRQQRQNGAGILPVAGIPSCRLQGSRARATIERD